jgi:hypothetical protein
MIDTSLKNGDYVSFDINIKPTGHYDLYAFDECCTDKAFIIIIDSKHMNDSGVNILRKSVFLGYPDRTNVVRAHISGRFASPQRGMPSTFILDKVTNVRSESDGNGVQERQERAPKNEAKF